MHEGIPSKEGSPHSKEKVIASLREDPQNLSVLQEYLATKEAEVYSSLDALRLNVETAEIYRDAGLMEAARDAFEAAAEQAYQEHEDELYGRLVSELERLEEPR